MYENLDLRNSIFLKNPIFDDCLLGYYPNGQTIYSMKRMIDVLVQSGEFTVFTAIKYINDTLFEEMVNYEKAPVIFNDLC